MSELGALFRQKREELGLSLDEAEQITRIRRRYLEAIEAGNWDALPPGVYTRGLLKNYARALDLSVNSVSRMYAKERPSEARLPVPQLISQPLIQEPRVSNEMLLAAAGFLIAGVLLAWLVITEFQPLLQEAADRLQDGGSAPVAATRVPEPTAVAVSTADTDAAAADDDTASRDASADADDNELDDSGGSALGGTRVAVATTPTPRPQPSPTAVQGLLVEVDATNSVWLRVLADGQEIWTGFMQAEESRAFEGREAISMKTGNAGGTDVTVNGQTLGILGASGEVKTCEWHVLEPGVIEMTGCDLPVDATPAETAGDGGSPEPDPQG